MNAYGSSPLELMAADAMLRGEVFLEYFTYSAAWITGTATALGANGTTEVQIPINADSDFLIQQMNLTAETAAGTFLATPDYLLLIVIAGSGRQIMNQAQHVANITGSFQNGSFPGRNPMPKLVQASNTISCTLTNRTAVAANRVDLALTGFKIFYSGGNRQQIFHVL
jgi:hypothetical protein